MNDTDLKNQVLLQKSAPENLDKVKTPENFVQEVLREKENKKRELSMLS